MHQPESQLRTNRRAILGLLTGMGIGTATWQRAVASSITAGEAVTAEMLQQAEWVADVELSDDERNSAISGLQKGLRNAEAIRKVDVDYNVPPSVLFNPAPFLRPGEPVVRNQAINELDAQQERPKSNTDLAFLPVWQLASLIRSRKLSSVELTKIYLQRLKKFDPLLHCVVTLTEDLALKQATKADSEIQAGKYRGPLHGIPWGAKDLMAVQGYPTTWGATPFEDQQFDHSATVADRLEEAGAVLVAKLSLGALAMGDRWMGKKTRNPWDPRMGSSGSSAGSACAATAGLVGFTIGTETLGSIVSPSKRCGATSLRPTFGRISRYGMMPLSWTMDKAGPLCRSVADCALVLDAVHGSDGKDPSATDHPFDWTDSKTDLSGLRIGYIRSRTPDKDRPELEALRTRSATLIPISLPDGKPVWEMTSMLEMEAATVFADVTKSHVTEGLNSWPAIFRAASFMTATHYIQASRVRTLLMQDMAKLMQQVDLYVGGQDLGITNLTGHPTVVMPMGFVHRGELKRPYSVTLTGQLFGESTLLHTAALLEQSFGVNTQQPDLEAFLADMNSAQERRAAEQAEADKKAAQASDAAQKTKSPEAPQTSQQGNDK
ncbi:MAG: amidase family protein [Fuerstiella sp.]